MKKFLLPLLLMIFTLTGCSDSKAGKDNNLIIGIDANFAPMTFCNEDGEIVGFDVDLAKETARRMNVNITFKPINWYYKEEEITSGNVDMIWSGLDIIDEYKEYMIFSKPYMDNRQVLFIRKEDDLVFYSEYDLEGKIVATQSGSNSETYINKNKKLKNSFMAFVTYDNIRNGFSALSKGKYDVLIVDEIAARYEMTKRPNMFEIIELTVGSTTEFGIGFRKGDKELCDRVQKSLDSIVKDGTAKKISEKWFQADLIKLKKY